MRNVLFAFIFWLAGALSIRAQDGGGTAATDAAAPNRNSAIWLQIDSETFEQITWWSRIAQVELTDESTAEIRLINNGMLRTELVIHSKPAIERLLKRLSEEGNSWIPAITTALHSRRGYVNWNYVQKVKRVQVTEPAPHDGLELTAGLGKPKILLGTVDDSKQVARLIRAVQEIGTNGLSSSSR